MSEEQALHVDVLIVGAGLSGIGAAWHLQARCPSKSFLILESRVALGGTWDLFRYPGIRSDSDMYTLGYRFKPWRNPQSIADGAAILDYIRDTAREHRIEERIRFGHTVTHVSWSSGDARWTVHAKTPDGSARFSCGFLWMCTGYYDYEAGYAPAWPDMERYGGQVVHPQHWPADLHYAGRRVVVIGSGATAITLVPALAKDAAHVTMLQRTPSYIITRPSEDGMAMRLRRLLPERVAYAITRWKNVLLGMVFYRLAKRRPRLMRRLIMKWVKTRAGNAFVESDFTPPYEPWDQRLCLAPNGDLFDVLRDGRASIVTDHIERFTERGIRLRSGRELEADIVVTATGLRLRVLGGTTVDVDGRRIQPHETLAYRGTMYSDVPNLAAALGYTNASWTLKCDLAAEWVCRLLNYMDAHGYVRATPRRTDPTLTDEPIIDFSSGYVQRSLHELPRQGSRMPWRLHQNYARDLLALRYGSLRDGELELR